MTPYRTLLLLGLSFIKSYEEFRAKVYKDSNGFDTVGYGHKCLKGEVWPACGIDIARAVSVLSSDLQEPSRTVNVLVRVPIEQHHFDALVSFTFNVGSKRLRDSTLLRLLNNGMIKECAEHFEEWDHADGKVVEGLKKRRDAERDIFLKSVYVNHI
jgi:lysozyme